MLAITALVYMQIYAFRRQSVWVPHYSGLSEQLLMLSELSYVCALSLLWCATVYCSQAVISWPVLCLALLFNLLLAAAIISMRCFGIALNVDMLRQALIYRKQLSNGDTNTLQSFGQVFSFDLFAYPIIYSAAYASLIWPSSYLHYAYWLAIVYSIGLALRIRTSVWYNVLGLLLVAAILQISTQTLYPMHAIALQHVSAALVLAYLAVPCLVEILKRRVTSPLLPLRCSIARLFAKSMLPKQKDFKLRAGDQAIIEIPAAPLQPSSYFGVCRGANVILVTLESVSAAYTNPHAAGHAAMPYFDKLAQDAWLSQQHICISPNTYTAYAAMFLGSYFKDQENPYAELLVDAGYRAAYMWSANSEDIMHKLGFNASYDSSCIDGSLQLSDELRFNLLLKQLQFDYDGQSPLFLHIKNEQTHHPYEVYHSTAAADPLARYKQAVTESDQLVEQLIAKLGDMIDLDNTIIVYTSDHGQSFGEKNYYLHSTAVNYSQLHVPFLLTHPNLKARAIPYSSHFDIFPTLLDLLGIEDRRPRVGVSLGHPEVPFSHTVFSELRCGDLPACFGHIDKQRKIFIDVSRNLTEVLDHHDQPLQTLTPQDKKYYQQLLVHSMAPRGLIARPMQPSDWVV